MVKRRVKKRRSRFGAALMQGVAIYILAYFPALSWGNPMISVGMASLMMILVSVKSSSVRAGFIRGLVLGTLAGMAIWGGLGERLKMEIYAREHPVPQQPAESAQADDADAGADAANVVPAVPDDAPPAADGDEESVQPADSEPVATPLTQEELAYYDDIRRRLPYYSLPPPMMTCTAIGVIFAHLAGKRRRKVQRMWQ